jgi:hypothetical protein
MRLAENNNKMWFKILSASGRDLNNEMKKWVLPEGNTKPDWITSNCLVGTWIVSDPKEFMLRNNRAFIVELNGDKPIAEFQELSG